MNFLKQMETLFQAGTASGQSDGQLLERFVQRRDETAEAAFAALVDRHGAMVLRVCRQVLGDEHDAQDASQATFLVLARRAGSIGRRESVASWLHGVALRVAARARLAAARRRVRERRGGEIMAARQIIEIGADESTERYAQLHAELGRLPQSFREPLVLCYLEGLTQEQAAAQLRCPLGTVQSRLARGRAKLKSRLTKRGFELSTLLTGTAPLTHQSSPAPKAWAEATVRLAMQFTRTKGLSMAAAPAALADEVLRAMVVTELKVALGALVCATLLVTGAATWDRHEPLGTPIAVAANVAAPVEKSQPAPAPQEPRDLLNEITVPVRGTVRDELGRPVAQAWIGTQVRLRDDLWKPIQADRVRDRQEPFRDDLGKVVPPGALGNYFELRDEGGNWQPIDPHDIRSHVPSGYTGETVDLRDQGVTRPIPAAGHFDVRVSKGRPRMGLWPSTGGEADRTNADGEFAVELQIRPGSSVTLHAASRDFSQRAVKVVRVDDPKQPCEMTVKRVRHVHARVIETPIDHPELLLPWELYSIDEKGLDASDFDFLQDRAPKWGGWPTEAVWGGGFAPPEGREFKALLPEGRYRIWFHSDTTMRLVDFVVPAGPGPLEMPDIHLETLAWVKHLGKPAPEIEAIDLDGKPVKLADFRGKVVVLMFCVDRTGAKPDWFELLSELRKRFEKQPLEILALHDASVTSREAFNNAATAIRDKLHVDQLPFHFLLDRPPTGKTGPYRLATGVDGSGRSFDNFEVVHYPTTMVIDANGMLIFSSREFGMGESFLDLTTDQNGKLVFLDGDDALRDFDDGHADGEASNFLSSAAFAWVLEDQLGMPRSRARKTYPDYRKEPLTAKGHVIVTGTVVDSEGRPINGAKVSPIGTGIREHNVTTSRDGQFKLTAEDIEFQFKLEVAAEGRATRTFDIDASWRSRPADAADDDHIFIAPGPISAPLKLTPGVAVTGRLVQAEKPIPGITLGLRFVEEGLNLPTDDLQAVADDHGRVQFPHVLADREFWVYAALGSLPDDDTLVHNRVRSGRDGTILDLGDLRIRKGHLLAGRVVLADGQKLAGGATVWAQCPAAAGELPAELDKQGRFRIHGLPDGVVYVSLVLPQGPARPAYRLSSDNKCLDPERRLHLVGQITGDIDDLTILLEPGTPPENEIPVEELDPAIVADFNDAKSGPITGVPPRP
jgi:RNA polymerase sigma factor (sigma-70 family)